MGQRDKKKLKQRLLSNLRARQRPLFVKKAIAFFSWGNRIYYLSHRIILRYRPITLPTMLTLSKIIGAIVSFSGCKR